ncbi:MAG TPA: hypothetical protein DDY49_00935 [Paenibacillaceae bacterium]|nr:hypothetical protein [Paenibacillaceae bacterium]
MITVKRPIKVKMILTEDSRKQLEEEFSSRKKRYELELEQLQFQGKKLLLEAQRRGMEAQEVVQQRMFKEESSRRKKISDLDFQIQQLSVIPDGSEVLYTTVESEIEVKVGDNWDHVINQAEIILLDGVIHEIRGVDRKQ